jgi:hypothetical protein
VTDGVRLVTGVQAAGKSTVANLLAAEQTVRQILSRRPEAVGGRLAVTG